MQDAPIKSTVIRQADWVVAWDGSQHVYLNGADVAFDATGVTFVGHGYKGEAATVIDGRRPTASM